jgi:hypothetical protein
MSRGSFDVTGRRMTATCDHCGGRLFRDVDEWLCLMCGRAVPDRVRADWRLLLSSADFTAWPAIDFARRPMRRVFGDLPATTHQERRGAR